MSHRPVPHRRLAARAPSSARIVTMTWPSSTGAICSPSSSRSGSSCSCPSGSARAFTSGSSMVSSSGTTTDVSAAGVKPSAVCVWMTVYSTGRQIRDVELTIVLAVADLLSSTGPSTSKQVAVPDRRSVGDEDDQPARPALRLLIFDRDLGGACDDVDALAVRGLISRRRGHLFQPVATGWHSIETNDAVVGSVVSVAALDRLIAVALGQRPAAPGHEIPSRSRSASTTSPSPAASCGVSTG